MRAHKYYIVTGFTFYKFVKDIMNVAEIIKFTFCIEFENITLFRYLFQVNYYGKLVLVDCELDQYTVDNREKGRRFSGHARYISASKVLPIGMTQLDR